MSWIQTTILKSLWAIGLVLGPAFLLLNAEPVEADIVITLQSVTQQGEEPFQYTYDVSLTAGSYLHVGGGDGNRDFSPSNNFFTLYDIRGLVADSITYGGALVGNAVSTEQSKGVKPPLIQVVPANDQKENATIYWVGPDVVGPADLGMFSFRSTVSFHMYSFLV